MIFRDELDLLDSDDRCTCGHAMILHASDDWGEQCNLPDCTCSTYQQSWEPWPRLEPPKKVKTSAVSREYSKTLERAATAMNHSLAAKIHEEPLVRATVYHWTKETKEGQP